MFHPSSDLGRIAMSIADHAPAGSLTTAKRPSWIADHWGLLAAIAALIAILLLPTPAGLPVAGHRMLAILGFAVIVWMTEAIDYAVSAIVIAALMAFPLGFSPNPANPKALMGTGAGLTLAFSGFANTALVLVASALFLAAAMSATGLDKRSRSRFSRGSGPRLATWSSARFWSVS
jgi:di/tricarboxylate transporter